MGGGKQFVVLYSDLSDHDWPDVLDVELGRFTYYGDNKKPGHPLHETKRAATRFCAMSLNGCMGTRSDRPKHPTLARVSEWPWSAMSRSRRRRRALPSRTTRRSGWSRPSLQNHRATSHPGRPFVSADGLLVMRTPGAATMPLRSLTCRAGSSALAPTTHRSHQSTVVSHDRQIILRVDSELRDSQDSTVSSPSAPGRSLAYTMRVRRDGRRDALAARQGSKRYRSTLVHA